MSTEAQPGAAAGPAPRDESPAKKSGLGALTHIINHLGVAVASKLVPVASIFLYSHNMPVHDYGVLNLASSYLWILAIVMTLNLHTAIGRYIYTGSADFSSFLGTSYLSMGAVFGLVAALILSNLTQVAQLVTLPATVIVLLLLIVVGAISESVYTQIAIYLQHSGKLVRVVSSKALLTLLLSIAALQVLERDQYLAVLYADAAVSLGFFAYVILALRGRTQWRFHTGHLRYIVQYSVPLIPYMLCLTLLSQFDRVMIDRYFGKEATGLYSLSYNVGILMLMVVTALLNVFNPAFFDRLNNRRYAEVIKDSEAIFALATVVTLGLVLFGQVFFDVLVPEKYDRALDLIPAVAIGGLCFVIFQLWARVIAYANKTYWLSLIGIFSVAVKIGLNMWLLPLFGYKAAASTTVIAYLLMSVLCVLVVNHAIALFTVCLLPALTAVAACTAVTLLFAYIALAVWLAYALKIVLMIAALLFYRRTILGLLSLRDIPGRA